MKNAQIYLSRGNEKIVQSYIFNLPIQVSCPGATKLCKACCYAKPPEYLYPTCKTSRDRNLETSKKADFSELIIAKLKSGKFKRLRIHESGDFYNQAYLDKWVKIIKARPDITFWAYTKSFRLDFTEAKKLPNFYLRVSTDASSTKEALRTRLPKSILSSEKIEGLFTCPSSEVEHHAVQCMKDCYYCIENRLPLVFLPHGTYKNKVKTFEMEACNGCNGCKS